MESSSEPYKKDEITYINIAKALGIIFIVFGHAIEPSPINNFLNLFHVPLFYFISGYLFKDAYILKPAYFIGSKIKNLYLPFVKYGLFFLIFHNIFLKLNIYNSTNYPIPHYSFYDFCLKIFNIIVLGESEPISLSLWFLISLFMVNLLFFIISYALKGIKNNKINEILKFIIILAIFITGNIFAYEKIEIPLGINGALIMLAIFYIGYLYNKTENVINKYNILNGNFALIAILSLIFNVLYIKTEVSIYANQYSNSAPLILFAILGIYAILFFSKILEKKSASEVLCYIGKNTIPIIALHILSFKLNKFNNNKTVWPSGIFTFNADIYIWPRAVIGGIIYYSRSINPFNISIFGRSGTKIIHYKY